MKNDLQIKFSQLLILLFLSSLFPFMLISGETLSRIGVWSVAVWLFITLLQVPLLIFASKRSISLQKDFLGFIAGASAFAFLLCTAVRFSAFFADFFTSMINTASPKWFIVLCMLACVCYACIRGVRGLSSAAIIFSAFAVLMLILLVIGAVPRIKAGNLGGITGSDENIVSFVMLLLSVNFIFPSVLIFNGNTGKPKTSAALWIPIAAAAVQALIILLIALCLGKYAFTQQYPVLTLFRSPKLNMLESVSGVWFLMLTMLCLTAVSVCLSASAALLNKPCGKRAALVLSAALFAFFLLDESGLLKLSGETGTYISAALSVLSAALCFIKSKSKAEA